MYSGAVEHQLSNVQYCFSHDTFDTKYSECDKTDWKGDERRK